MPPTGYFIDANLLVLLVVGNTDKALISKHRRLRGYSVEDYDTLINILSQAELIFITPNTLTEASNLLAQHGDPERSLIFDTFRDLIHDNIEVVIRSRVASSRSEFNMLGLTDSVLLEVVSEETPLITVDMDLYLAAVQEGWNAALNFNHLRGL